MKRWWELSGELIVLGEGKGYNQEWMAGAGYGLCSFQGDCGAG